MAKESKTNQILFAIVEIRKDIKQIFLRLDKINGSIADYPVLRERLANTCNDMNSINHKIENKIEPALTNMKIKFYTIVSFTALISGGIGSAIGALIVRSTG